MHRRLGGMAVAVGLMAALAVPAVAQDGTSSVSFDGTSFEFARSLGRSVNITQVRPEAVSDTQIVEGAPAHVTFSLYGLRAESQRIPRIWDVPGTVRVYDVAALDGRPLATRQLEELQQLLADRPSPETLEADIVDGVEVPHMPIEEAAQALVARAHYIDTDELSGIAYLTGFRQDVFPFARDELWYSFQGLSTDGRWYVAVDWVLEASMLPRRVSQADAQQVGRNDRTWQAYIDSIVATLDAAAPTDFTPSLDDLDALVRSIDFDPVPGPGATVSPTPSVAPSAGASAAP